MDGYGRGEAANSEVSVFVEIRASSHRNKDIQIRLPQAYLPLERRIKKRVADKVSRGRLDVYIRRNGLRGQQIVQLDKELAIACYQQMCRVAEQLGKDENSVNFSSVFEQPGVITTSQREPNAMQEWIIVSTAVDSALGDMLQQRNLRGKELLSEMTPELLSLQAERGALSLQLDDLNLALALRLEKRLVRILGSRLNKDKLTHEAAILVEKSDITEELRRIEEHCMALGQLLHLDEKGVGREMDLIIQELMREMNTVSSKVIPAEATAHIVAMKLHLELLRDLISQVE